MGDKSSAILFILILEHLTKVPSVQTENSDKEEKVKKKSRTKQ
jgi:hypothetical protein